MHQGDLPSYLPLETEVGSFLIPSSDGGGDVFHSLDLLHDSDRDPSREVRDESGSIFDFVVFGANVI